jgi:RecA-family ATPase
VNEPNLDLAAEWGRHLAELPTDAAREQARAAARQARMLAMSEDELEKLGQPPVRTLGEFLDTEVEIPPMLVEPGLVARGGLTALIAKGGKGKTTLSFNRLIRWAMGKPLFAELPDVMAPTSPLRSLIIENEGAGWHTQNMLNAIIANNGFSPEEQAAAREGVHIWGDGGWSKMRLDAPENVEQVKRAVDRWKIDVLFMEPFRLLWRGEENSNSEMLAVLESFFDIAAEFGCAVMVSHHESKGAVIEGGDAMEKARGGSVFSDLGAVMERWAPVGQSHREWSLTKWRYADPPAPIRMSYDRECGGYRYVPEDENVRASCRC